MIRQFSMSITLRGSIVYLLMIGCEATSNFGVLLLALMTYDSHYTASNCMLGIRFCTNTSRNNEEIVNIAHNPSLLAIQHTFCRIFHHNCHIFLGALPHNFYGKSQKCRLLCKYHHRLKNFSDRPFL